MSSRGICLALVYATNKQTPELEWEPSCSIVSQLAVEVQDTTEALHSELTAVQQQRLHYHSASQKLEAEAQEVQKMSTLLEEKYQEGERP
jgi:hypothetical protein